MEQEKDSFKDYAYRGIDALLKLSAKAGDSLRVASNKAIDKLDSIQLERNLGGLYIRLGKQAYTILFSGREIKMEDSEVGLIIEEITTITAELARRNSSANVK